MTTRHILPLPPFFTDANGKQTIIMFPNARLVFLALTMIGDRIVQPEWHTWTQLLVLVAITMWASDEFIDGASTFRKLLGFSFLFYVGVQLLLLSYRL
jgi:hypothetical protein